MRLKLQCLSSLIRYHTLIGRIPKRAVPYITNSHNLEEYSWDISTYNAFLLLGNNNWSIVNSNLSKGIIKGSN